jgi:hypothetical protein
MLKPRAVVTGVFVALVLPLWFFFAWALGLIPIGEERSLDREEPTLVEQTERSAESLGPCLSENYSGWLALTRTSSPYRPPNTRRLRNRASHIVVDVTPQGAGSVLRVYKTKGSPLSRRHVIALQTCIPEYGLPAVSDPRNDAFYQGLLNNSAAEDLP